MKLKNLIGQNAFWMVNKAIARQLDDLEAALMLSYLIDKEDYHDAKGELHPDGWFFCTSERMEEDICLSYKKQKRCIKKLVDAELILTKVMGVPAKLHFTICENKISLLVNSSIAEKSKLELPKGENYIKNTITKNSITNSIGSSIEQPTPASHLAGSKVNLQNKDSIEPKSSKTTSRKVIAGAANFEPPTFEQVKEGFEALIRAKAELAIPTSISLHAASNAEAFTNFYSRNEWKVKSQGKLAKMKDWKSSVLQWFLKENSSGRYNRAHGNDLAHQNKQKQERLQPAPAVLASSPFRRKVG